ncbi:MAG: deoxyribodipyrimidine photo-lyase, partial [Acetobacteraceae bacterium]|nr:deoxyribodipyrimidine photo-lyase [Acetobacteraceae bacterium]
MIAAPVILWFRQDLRLADNPALAAVAGQPVLPLYVIEEDAADRWLPGAAARWWLQRSLRALDAALSRLGAPLLVLR